MINQIQSDWLEISTYCKRIETSDNSAELIAGFSQRIPLRLSTYINVERISQYLDRSNRENLIQGIQDAFYTEDKLNIQGIEQWFSDTTNLTDVITLLILMKLEWNTFYSTNLDYQLLKVVYDNLSKYISTKRLNLEVKNFLIYTDLLFVIESFFLRRSEIF